MEGKADETQPPYKVHFNINAWIKTIPKVSSMLSCSTVEPATSSAAIPLAPLAPNSTQFAPLVALSSNSASDFPQLLVLQQLQQQQQQHQFIHPHPSYLSPVPPLHIFMSHYNGLSLPSGANKTLTVSVPPSPSNLLRVSLDAFVLAMGSLMITRNIL